MKAFIWVCDLDNRSHFAEIDLKHLPHGASRHVVHNFAEQGAAIAFWLQSDLARAAQTLARINTSNHDEQSLRLISLLASFAENAPPEDEPRDLLLAVSKSRADLHRMKTAVLADIWTKLKQLPGQGGNAGGEQS